MNATVTVSDVAFPDGREGVFGVSDTSTVSAALVAFALTDMSLRAEPIPVIRARPGTDDQPPEAAGPVVDDIVGSVRVARLREVEPDAVGRAVSEHLEAVPPAVPVDLTAAEALARLGTSEMGLVVRGNAVVGMVTRRELTAAVDGAADTDAH